MYLHQFDNFLFLLEKYCRIEDNFQRIFENDLFFNYFDNNFIENWSKCHYFIEIWLNFSKMDQIFYENRQNVTILSLFWWKINNFSRFWSKIDKNVIIFGPNVIIFRQNWQKCHYFDRNCNYFMKNVTIFNKMPLFFMIFGKNVIIFHENEEF